MYAWMTIDEMLALIPEEEWDNTSEPQRLELVHRVRIEASCRLFASPAFHKQWMIDQLHFYLDFPNGITLEQGQIDE